MQALLHVVAPAQVMAGQLDVETSKGDDRLTPIPNVYQEVRVYKTVTTQKPETIESCWTTVSFGDELGDTASYRLEANGFVNRPTNGEEERAKALVSFEEQQRATLAKLVEETPDSEALATKAAGSGDVKTKPPRRTLFGAARLHTRYGKDEIAIAHNGLRSGLFADTPGHGQP